MRGSSIMGAAVLAYALLTVGTLPGIHWGWAEAANGALWFAYLGAGVGLLRQARWGSALTIVATSASLLVMLVAGSRGGSELNYFSPVWLMGATPVVALLAGALLITLPSRSPRQATATRVDTGRPPGHPRDRRRRGIAHGSFGVLGLIGLWTAHLTRVDPSEGVIGFLVMIPFGLPLIVALGLGLGMTVVLRDDARLNVLSTLTVAIACLLLVLDLEDWTVPLGLYSAACILAALDWFVKQRREDRQQDSTP